VIPVTTLSAHLHMSASPIPNAGLWKPRRAPSETLTSAFLNQCSVVEQEIQLRTEFERKMGIDNFDSGLPLEEIVRAGFQRLLPHRYSTRQGVLVDRLGQSAGECDVVFFNDLWFPAVKVGSTPQSRRTYLPIEGVYAVGEVKQTLSYQTLDAAMEKLVTAHRLHRPNTHRARTVENRSFSSCHHGLSNPLFSFVFATGIAEGETFQSLVERFFDINKQLRRLEVVRALCVLGYGCVIWGFKQNAEVRPALFMLEDLYLPLVPVYFDASSQGSALYVLMENLSLHLYHSVLAPEDLVPGYGWADANVAFPTSEAVRLDPDEEWLELLKHPCSENEELPSH
jgi:hypothetical protein